MLRGAHSSCTHCGGLADADELHKSHEQKRKEKLQYAHQKDFLRSSDVLWESSKDVP